MNETTGVRACCSQGQRHADVLWSIHWTEDGVGPDATYTEMCTLHVGEALIDGIDNYTITRVL